MTTLTKQILTTYIPGTAGSPGSAGSPAQPAHTATVTTQVLTWVYVSATDSSATYIGGNVSTSGNWVQEYKTVTTTVYYPATAAIPATPAVAATPSQTIQNFQLGWSGRADSIAQLTASGNFTFSLPASNVGAVVGMSAAPQSAGYTDIQYGIYSAHGIAQVYESGVSVFNYGAHTITDVFKIRKRDGVVDYLVNGTVIYTSTVKSNVGVQLSAALYSGGDSVVSASMGTEQGGYNTMTALDSRGGYTAYKAATGYGMMQPLVATAYQVSVYLANTMMALDASASGGETYQYSVASMSAMSASASGFPTASYSLANTVLDYPNAYGSGKSGTIGESYVSLQALASNASGHSTGSQVLAYGDASASMLSMVSYGYDAGTPHAATMISGVSVHPSVSAVPYIFLTINASGRVTGVVTLQSFLSGNVSATMHASSSVLSQSTIRALMTAVASMANINFDDGTASVWVVNTKNDGTTRYSNYGFNSFAKIGSKHYGVMRNGLYLLDGPNDAGTPIPAAVNFGNSDFGTSKEKALMNCYVGVSSTGAAVLKVVANGATYFYTARSSSPTLQTQRIDLGRGLRANYYELELQNTNGGAIEFESIEFTPLPLSRRI